jgi:hypothetical protein
MRRVDSMKPLRQRQDKAGEGKVRQGRGKEKERGRLWRTGKLMDHEGGEDRSGE